MLPVSPERACFDKPLTSTRILIMPVKMPRTVQAPRNLQALDFAWILVTACAFQVSQGGQVGFGQGQVAHLMSLETAPVKLGTAGGGWNVMAWVLLHPHRSLR